MNKYNPHLFIIPEDEADERIANGFIMHHGIKDSRQVFVTPVAGGWRHVLDVFKVEYVPWLRQYSRAHVILLIDFDGQFAQRRGEFEAAIPGELTDRVFVLGAQKEPETLKKALGMSLENIGRALAEDCANNTSVLWGHEQLQHNDGDRLRLVQSVKPFLFC
jgi:hypothetical protein